VEDIVVSCLFLLIESDIGVNAEEVDTTIDKIRSNMFFIILVGISD